MSDARLNEFHLMNCAERGDGVFAARDFSCGEIVMVGVIEKELRGNHSHASQIGKDQYVLHAGLISKVNHSCAPNCGIGVNETGAHDFVAMKSISVDEEITFDYAMRNYGVDHFPDVCMCGASTCRGRITGWRDLSESKKKEYGTYAAPYLRALDTVSRSKL